MSLIVDDAHIDAVKTYIMEQGDTIGNITRRYVNTMQNVVETGIMEGATADALKEFLFAIRSDVSENSSAPALMDVKVERFCTNFIERIDKADKEIY